MPFDDSILNATLVTSGVPLTDVAAAPGRIVFGNAASVDHFYIDNSGAAMSGDYDIVGFGKNDTVLSSKKIFDGNNDGIIAFGENAVLDTERFGGGDRRRGDTQVNMSSESGEPLLALRFLGTKDGLFAYADASVRLAGFTEGFVSDDIFDVSTGAFNLFFDNALGLNLGADTILGLGADDTLTFTSQIFDRTGEDIITFGANGVLDVSGNNGPLATDPADSDTTTADAGDHPGGQIAFDNVTSIAYLGSYDVAGVTYYEYGVVV